MDLLTGNVSLLVLLVGIVGWLLGIEIIIRLGRGEVDRPAPWRYRQPRHEVATYREPRPELPRREPARRRPDALAARRTARGQIILALFLPIFALAAWIAQPRGFGPVSYEAPWYEGALPLVAAAAVYLFGLGWMIRIYRADPEPDTRTWRYRSET